MTTGYDNLIPAKPGEVRNPNGRPKGSRNRSTIYREWLEFNSPSGEANLDSVMRALILKASEGDVPAIKEIMDGAFGKIADKQELTGAEGAPLNLGVKFMDSKAEGETLGKPTPADQ